MSYCSHLLWDTLPLSSDQASDCNLAYSSCGEQAKPQQEAAKLLCLLFCPLLLLSRSLQPLHLPEILPASSSNATSEPPI